MPHRIKRAAQRLAFSRAMLELHRLWARTYFNTSRFGTRTDELLLCGAIMVGQLESRPMTAAKLSDFAGLPRPTAIRKLSLLEKRGLAVRVNNNGAYVLSVEFLNSVEAIACADAVRTQIIRLGELMSKLDTMDLAAQCCAVMTNVVT